MGWRAAGCRSSERRKCGPFDHRNAAGTRQQAAEGEGRKVSSAGDYRGDPIMMNGKEQGLQTGPAYTIQQVKTGILSWLVELCNIDSLLELERK